MNAARYYIALIVVVAFPPPVLAWFIIHPIAEKWRRIGPLVTYQVISVFIALGMFSIWSVRGWLLSRQFGFRAPLAVLAAVFLCAAIYLRRRWRRVIRPSAIIGLPEVSGRRAPGELVTDGIYSHIRHPRYVEVGLFLAAAAFFSNYLAAYVVGLAYIPLINMVASLEERELRRRFGAAYEDYCRRVPRFIPNVLFFRRPGGC